jgi:hypothetical protein
MKHNHSAYKVLLLWLSIIAGVSQAFSNHRLLQQRWSIGAHHSSKLPLDPETNHKLWTKDELIDFARNQGLDITLTTLGPGFRSTARSLLNNTHILGYVEGFARGNILHLDKMEVFQKAVKSERLNNPQFKGGGTSFGVGLLMGYLCVLHGRDKGCRSAEFLAINDDDYLHKRLVRYYSAAGMDVIKYVGDDVLSIPDRLVWGGCGTLMRKDVDGLLAYWSGILSKSVERKRSASR